MIALTGFRDFAFSRIFDVSRVRRATLQSRVARGKFCCGLGVWAVRAGSIGRDGRRLGERTEPPPKDAGGLGPRPLHEEITAYGSKRTDRTPRPGRLLAFTPDLNPLRPATRDGRVAPPMHFFLGSDPYFR